MVNFDTFFLITIFLKKSNLDQNHLDQNHSEQILIFFYFLIKQKLFRYTNSEPNLVIDEKSSLKGK